MVVRAFFAHPVGQLILSPPDLPLLKFQTYSRLDIFSALVRDS